MWDVPANTFVERKACSHVIRAEEDLASKDGKIKIFERKSVRVSSDEL